MQGFVDFILQTRRPLYCASPLFSPLARIGAATLAGWAEQQLAEEARKKGKDVPHGLVFLPFRDTDQDSISGPDRARQIFEADIRALASSSGVLARFDNLAKDTGVCMEIGYAYGLGIPVGVMCTDFMGEGSPTAGVQWQVDPVVAAMSQVHVCSPTSPPISRSYFQTQLIHESDATRTFVVECLASFSPPAPVGGCVATSGGGKADRVFVDMMGGRYEWARGLQGQMRDALQQAGLRAHVAERFADPRMATRFPAVETDMANFAASDTLIICGDGAEIDPGSAALFGLALARGMKTILLYSADICYMGEGGQVMRVNLMIDQGASAVARSAEQAVREAVRFHT